ncbi:GNAT family N-acetyltransferase [Cellulomonas sp. PS-H5]|uniref:GNAT family N-acetyltransferase n=1 Tax=Cellulomonas sp. PS-H5 TaxID=2820400 RepID=UPI001C4FA842|nr:GNAT family N-acetyltransferase [Cellulomonas sp. PS-H5]MBW0253180.1 GNAT family N-acetyltransferase [Cellulomonas sp. PS-H5]
MPDVAPPPHPVRWDDLTGRLRALRVAAGSPSYADLVRRVDAVRAARGVPGPERRPGRVTVYDAFRDGRARLDVELVADLVRALGGTAEDAARWRAAHAAVATALAAPRAGGDGTAAGAGDAPDGAAAGTGLLRTPDDAAPAPVLRGRDAELAELLAWASGAAAAAGAGAEAGAPGAPDAGAAADSGADVDPGADAGPDPARVAVLTGVPGSGLTALAQSVARTHRARGAAPVLLGPGDLDPDLVATALPATPAAPPAAPSAPGTSRAPGLLVLLDVDDPDRPVAVARALAEAAPGWSLLVTARRALPVAGARTVRLAPLAPEAAVAMLGDLVGPERVAAEPEAAAALAAACGHLPVALAVAAGQVAERPAWSLADQVHRVAQSSHALPALDAAYRALDPEQALVLRRLALLDAALSSTWLAVLAGLDAPSVRRALAALEDAHLVLPAPGGRSTVHALVRRYAREAAQDDEPVSARRAAVERLVAGVVEVARPLVAVVAPHHDLALGSSPVAASPAVAREGLDALRPVAVAAGARCADLGIAAPLGELSGLLAAYLDTAGHYADALVLHGAAAAAADPAGRSRAGRDLGRVLEHLGRYDEALAQLVRAHESGHDPRPGQTLNRIGNVYKRLGRTDEALRAYADAAAAARAGGDVVSEGRAVGNHADALRVLGRHDESFAGYDLALALAERVGDVLNVAVVTSNSALALEHVGRIAEARARVAQARAAADRLGDANLGLRTALHEQRLVLTAGDPAELRAAVPALRALAERAGDLGDVEAQAEARTVLGRALHRVGDLDAAEEALAGARDQAARIRAGLVEVEALNALGAVALASGLAGDARDRFDRALALARAAGDAGEEARALAGLEAAGAAQAGAGQPGPRAPDAAAAGGALLLRDHTPDDAAATLAVFRRAITVTAARDYTPEQVAAWAPDDIDPDAWGARRAAARTRVAVRDGAVVGFTDVDAAGYVDMMFVDPGAARQGVARALLDWAVRTAAADGATELTTHASVTARPFFEAHGFEVVAEQHPVRRGVTLTNYRMRRPL